MMRQRAEELPAIQVGRPYPPTELSTAQWRLIRAEWVEWSRVTTTQEHVSILGVLGVPGPHSAMDDRPHCVEHEGRLYLEDGAGRMIRDLLEGRRHGYVRVLRR